MSKPLVFISYSHKDKEWKDRLRAHLGGLEKTDRITVWDDRQIDAGDQWFGEITQAMERAAVALCLISADFLRSDFVTKEEIPFLLQRRRDEGMIIIPVLVHRCLWPVHEWINKTQMLPREGDSIAEDYAGKEDIPLTEIAQRVFEIVEEDRAYVAPAPPKPRWPALAKKLVAIERLPVTGSELFGRQSELKQLDEAWESAATTVLSYVAWGGVGKSTLVNKWLERMTADNYRGAQRVYAWSFYSQGTGDRVTSADLFIADALEWFGDPDPKVGSPWAKGERLAALVREHKTLLLLDGVEPLQSYDGGKINDPALAVLVEELARENPGLCVITTRVAVPELGDYPETAVQESLEQISAEAGRALLRVRNVQGTDTALEFAVRDFGHHALAVNLLAAYLRDVAGHPIAEAANIPDLDVTEDEGKHPRRVIAAFAERFGNGPEVELLRVLGLFDRPAQPPEIAAVRESPAIPDLTTHLENLGDADWLLLLERLRAVKLLAPASSHQPNTLDAHPLVREHFADQVRTDHPNAWREGHNRLYEYFKGPGCAKELPNTIEEMAPLFAAVIHGCHAGRHQEALHEVYYTRVQRGGTWFSRKVLGVFGAELAALRGFLDTSWHQPVSSLEEADQGFVLGTAGSGLRAIGRLVEAVEPMKAGLEQRLAQEHWRNAAPGAGNLSELFLTLGDVQQAVDYARQSVKLADRSGDGFWRTYMRTALADALHQAGRQDDAETAFREAEKMQQELDPLNPTLCSVQGYHYCDLLLDLGQHEKVRERAERALIVASRNRWLLDIALDHLSLGRACLMAALQDGTFDFTEAADHLRQAVEGLRGAGQQDDLPRGLLGRAECYRVRGEREDGGEWFERARRDLDETMRIAKRSSMRLYEADAHLEYARLLLADGNKTAEARKRVDIAKTMIKEAGYHRRDQAVAELEQELT